MAVANDMSRPEEDLEGVVCGLMRGVGGVRLVKEDDLRRDLEGVLNGVVRCCCGFSMAATFLATDPIMCF